MAIRVLIVDDHESNLRYLETLFGAEGWEVHRARHGAEALEVARRTPPDVVVSDLLMPVMDGYTLLRHWRADPALQRIPFVVFTATYTEPEDAALADRLGASAFILKPAEPGDLLPRIRSAIAAAPPAARAPAEEPKGEVAELYSSVLVRKLEEKTGQLEEAWRALERDAQRRHAADEALQAALRQQELLLESVAEGIHGLDTGGGIVFENAVAAAMFGWDRNEMIGQDAHALVHHHRADGSAFPPDACPVYRTLRDGQVRRVDDEVFFRKDGTPFPVAYTCAPVRDETGRITGAVVSFRDVTAERAAEAQLAQQGALLRIAGQVARIGGWRIDLPDRTLTWSDEIRAMHDLPPGTQASLIQGMDFFTAESRPVMDRCLAACIRDGTPYDVEVEKVTATGRRIWVRNIGEAVRDAEGRIIRVQGAFQDITERKAADALLREQAALLDKAQDAIVVRDLDQRVRYWNKSAERLYGWTAPEVTGRSVSDLFYPTPESRRTFEAAISRVLETGEWVGELEQRTRDGRTVTIEGRWTLVRDDAGRPTSILAINTDITRRKALEQQFIRAQRLESIGTLAGGIAHDLNNVLAPIIMSIDLLAASARDRETLETLELIGTSARRGAELVRQVLSFARGLESRRSALDPGRAIHDVVRIVSDTFPRNIRVVERLEGPLRSVDADPTQLHQVILNLCVNARDAMAGGGTLTLAAGNAQLDADAAALVLDAHPGNYVRLSVSDTGSGIPKELLDRIFEPFFTTKEVGKGTGLGLSTTMAIVKGHGGFIRVESGPGEGTRFDVYLPAHAEPARPESELAGAPAPRGNGERILVVDDELSLREVTRRALEAAGYRVTLAANGAEAVASFSRGHGAFAAVITDMMMPVMDGAATISAIRALDAAVPLIAVSGVTEGARTPAAHRVRHLPKPYSAEELLHALHEAIQDGDGHPRPGR